VKLIKEANKKEKQSMKQDSLDFEEFLDEVQKYNI